jgi:hypothetical protein
MSRTEITTLVLQTPSLECGEDIDLYVKRHDIMPQIMVVEGPVFVGWNDEIIANTDDLVERMQWLIDDSNWEDLEILARLARLLDGFNCIVVTSRQLDGRP